MTAACALVALEDWEEKLLEDNANARFLAEELSQADGLHCDVSMCQTNMFVFAMDKRITNPKGKKNPKLDHLGLAARLREDFDILTFPTF